MATADAYNVPQDDTGRRMAALGMLPTYTPDETPASQTPYTPAAPQPPQPGPDMSAWSWDGYKKARGFDGKDYEFRNNVWSDYVGKVLPALAQYTGDDPATLQAHFQQTYSQDKPVAPTRSTLDAATDTGKTFAKGVLGAAKSVSDLFDPTSGASQYFGQGVRDIDRSYSPVIADEMQRRDRLIADAQARGDSALGPTLQYMWRNPAQTAAEAAGMVAPMVVPGGVARAAAYLPMAAETAATYASVAPRVASAVNAVTGGAMQAGQVRGGIYDQIAAMPDDQLQAQSPEYAQLRKTMNEGQAKAAVGADFARNAPEILAGGALGAAGGMVGAERALAGLPTRYGRLGTALYEAGSQGAQGAAGQFATNYGLQRVLPGQDIAQNLGTAAATGAIYGGLTGAAVGGHQPEATDAPPTQGDLYGPPPPLNGPPDLRGQYQGPPRPQDPFGPTPPAYPPDLRSQLQGASDPGRGFPHPNFREGDETQLVSTDPSAITAANDIAAVTADMPRIISRDYVAQHLSADLRNGTLEQTAQQVNSLGRAARALMQRMQERTAGEAPATPALPAPAKLPALPSPEHAAPGAGYVVDDSGTVRPATYGDVSGSRAAQQRAQELGITPDVVQAQRMRDMPPGDDVPTQTEPTPPVSAPVEPSPPRAQPAPLPQESEPAVLQNRDRSTAAAIQQMNTIAANPDYHRLGFSRDFANGAPVVENNPSMDIPPDQLGRQDITVAADGRRIPVQYALVNADTLLPSNRVDGTPVAGYEKGQPDALRAIAGNGRVAGLQAAYDRGTTGMYRAGIASDAPLTGINPAVLKRMDKPVLVRIMPRDQVTRDIGDVSNTSGTAALSAVEQAHNDAARVNMDALDFDEAGEPSRESVRAFVRSMPVSEQVGLLNPDGSPTRQAVDRLMSATFARAYNDPELVRLYAQATDPEARTVLGGMATAAGAMSRLHGSGELDIRPIITEAAKVAVNARRQGVKLSDYARQGDITLPPETQDVLKLFAENSRSAKKIGESLQRAADFAYSESSKPSYDMFGPVEKASLENVLEKLHDTGRPKNLEQPAGREPVREDAQGRRDHRAGPADAGPSKVNGPVQQAGTGSEPAAARQHEVAASPQEDEPLLTQPTPDELRARDARQRQAQQDEQKRIDEADRRAKADAEAGEFTLTGSNRDADIAAAHGQGDLLAAAEPEPAKPTPAAAVAAKAEPKPQAEPPLQVKPLTDKAIIVTGDTKTHADRIKEIKGAIYNRKHNGWIFSKKREAEVRDKLADLTGEPHDRSTAVDLESDSRKGSASDRVGAEDVRDESGSGGERTEQRSREDEGARDTRQGDRSVPARPAPVDRAPRDQRVREPRERPATEDDVAGPDRDQRSGRPDDEGVPPERHGRGDAVRSAGESADDLTARVQAQRRADTDVPVRLGDLDNIRETLPVLLKEQQEDVAKAEKRFHQDGHPGILFTNGTGTGKTYTGLGIAKRFARRGKSNILFLAPTDAKVQDWLKDGRNLNLDIKQLEGVNDAGKGPVATTYANFGQNDSLVHRPWDLIVADESHYLMSNQQGDFTNALQRFRELTNHPDAIRAKAQRYFAREQNVIRVEREAREAEYKAQGKTDIEASRLAAESVADRQGELNNQVEAKYQGIRDEPMKNAAFLSATPFPYHKNLDYANGYLWPAWKHGGGGGPGERDQFYINNLGYNWRHHQLETPSAEVNQDFMERELNRRLTESGAVSGRSLKLDKDYSRDFVELENGTGRKIDNALNAILDYKGPYDMLRQYVDKQFDYHARSRLLENLKANDAVERAKKHLALGRKVVVFHGYKTGHTDNPFAFPSTKPPEVQTNHPDAQAEWSNQVTRFKSDFADVAQMNFNRLGNPIDAFQKAFGDRLALFNGDVPKAKRYTAIKEFNQDHGKKDVMLVQMKAGKEGISLHDTTGKQPRALMALPLPTSPTDAIQMEGRTYRTGNKSNAVIEYLKAGLNFERSTFANTIAQRARTAENLALGHSARDLERAFKDGYLSSSDFDPHPEQGTGGKAGDVQLEKLSPFEKAMTLYYAKMKERGKRHQRAGTDWFATPEPIGLKMAEWANLKPGEKALEPSAGDGAIARFFPENTSNTFVEPSNALQSRLAINARGDIKSGRFEDHHIANKYDGVVMNPPFGMGGKTAMEHVEKAMTHLRDGGRIVALIPEGGMADKRFQSMMESDAAKHVYHVANISLPTSAFERAGTAVKSHIVVLEKQTHPDRAARVHQRNLDLSDAEDTKTLFNRLKDYSLPERIPTGDAAQQKADFSRATRGGGMTASDVRSAISADPANRHVDIYPTLDEAPEHIREQAQAEGSQGVEGFHDPRTGRVALIADRIHSPAHAREVARHEVIGHYGLQNMLGHAEMSELERKINVAEKLGNRTFAKLGADVDRLQPNLPVDRRAREMVARMAERDMHNSFMGRVVDAVRGFLKRTGLVDHDMTDAEVRKQLRDTQGYLREHGRSLADPAPRMAAAEFSRPAPQIRTVPGTSIPAVERRPTLLERIQDIRANPRYAARSAARNTARLAKGGGTAPQPKWLENTVTNLFDYRNPLEQLVRRSGNTDAGRRFLNTMRTFEAKTQKDIHDFEHEHARPLLKTLAKAWNGKYKDMPYYKEHGYQQFLEDLGSVGNYVKHGKERNAVIAQKTGGNDLAGSGRTDAEIDAMQRDLARSAPGLEKTYEDIYRQHLKPMLDHRDDVLRKSGLLTPEMEKARPNYDWYLPLTGDPDETEDALSRSAAVSLKSPKAKQATGREGTLSQNALHNVLERTDVAIRRAGMQDFKRDFVNLMEKSPQAKDLAHAKINDGAQNEIFEKYTGDDGMIHRRVKANASMSPDALVLHDGNRTKVADIGNKKIFEALNGANKAQIDGVFGLPDKATRLLSSVYTRYNPTFPLMNKIRDVQSQLALIAADAPVKDRAGALRRTIANNASFLTQWKDKPGSEYHQWREKFERLGGSTMYSDLFRNDTMHNIEDEFAKTAGATRWHQAKAAGEKIHGFIDHVNEHMEMTSRIALFKALVDSGMPEQDAAIYSKNTMNFETKGRWGRQLGALYTFAGPALFDARRMAQSLRSPRGAAVLAAQFAAMYGMYGALKAMGGTDEDGVARLNKVPLSQTGRFLTLLDPDNPDGKGYKFPVGFGYARIALTLAAALHRYADGVDDGRTFAGNVAKDGLLSNFSPIDPTDVDPTKDVSAWAMQQFAPSLMKPLLQLAMNQNAQGSPIHKPDEWTGSKLHFSESYPGTPTMFKDAAKELHDGTGIDVYPETLQYLLRSYGGNGPMDAVRAIQLMGEKAGTQLSLSDIPFAQTFGSRVMNQDVTDFRQNYSDMQKAGAERKYAQESGTLDQFDAANPDVPRKLAIYDAANSEIKALYKQGKEVQGTEDPAQRQQAVRELNRHLRSVQMMANKAYREAQTH